MSNIPQAEIDYIKQNTSLVDLVRSSGVKLRKKGKEYMGLCPFHKDTKPKVSSYYTSLHNPFELICILIDYN